MKKLLHRRQADRGMTTAEYTVGTLGACTIGGVLVKVGQSPWFGSLVEDLFNKIPSILPF
ncbi:DUF4244 domain-containing protein [Aeromicrobium sp.]|uniref:DUF4244 domain-containing protein n=1 Tax=Aeromicrobium sp. TaxID=1871063 RepID=UPI0019CCF7A5|nr:DUF4244 domain-containing protein [Aeromicrobium sp.]MBC7630281.1 DUF4244 domain-containing protein [Aeromicrobium sp.]